MKIFIDTNIFISENYFLSNQAKFFLRAIRILGLEILVPEIVVDEVKGNFEKALKEQSQQFKKSQKGVAKLVKFTPIDISIDYEIKKYNKDFDDMLSVSNIRMLPYPKISLKEMVLSSYKAKKPFKSNGEGHKDYIIWRTLFEELKSSDYEDYYFLVNNDKDFCEKKGDKISLHSDLVQELGDCKQVPKIYTSLREFFDKKIKPLLSNLSPSDLPELSKGDIEKYVQEALEKELELYSTIGFEGLPFGGDVTVVGVHETKVESFTFADLEDEVLITVLGNVSIETEGFVDRGSLQEDMNAYEQHDYYILDNDWNDYVVSVGAMLITPFEITLNYSKADLKINSHDMKLLEETEDDYF